MTYENDEITDIEGAGGGGGCFPAGTKINTPSGYRNIEDLKIGDEVYGFHPRSGNVSVERVTETFKHPWEEVKETSPLVILDYDTGCLCVTKNHWIYRKNKRTGEYANFDEAGDLVVGDILTTEYGKEVVISKITDGPEYDFVYNLETSTHHTFIASQVRVHNGGGGKKSQKAHVHYEAPNDLRSKAVVRVLEVISEGEIVGLADGAKSVYFDSTPIQNADGTYNFGSVSLQQRYGLPSQDPVPGFPLVEAEKAVNVEVKYGSPIARAMTETGNTACRVTVSLPEGLYRQDTTNGDLFGHSVTLEIGVRPPSGTWVIVRNDTIAGKTMGAYERSYRVEAPGGSTGLWEVRVQRTNTESSTSDIKDKLHFARFTEIKDLVLPYNNTAYMAGTVDAESTGGNLPVRAYDCKGIKVKVPNNYTVATRAYSGNWNGTFKTEWCDNPAWVLYDLLTNARYGLGEFVKDYNVDKYSFYNAAVYNDVLVNDGLGTGSFAPRYTFNAQIMQRDESWQILSAVASCMRASLYIGGGIIKLIQDRPGSAVKLVSKANVIDGVFNYSSTTARDRHTAVNVTYNDPNDGFLPKIITCEDAAGITRYGYNKLEIAAFGCTVENQARRLGRWALETELRTTEQVTYRTSFAQLDLQPGDIIKLMDDDYASTIQAGKVVSATTTSITADKTITQFDGGTVDVVGSDGLTIESRTCLGVTNTNVITFSPAISPAPVAWSDWILTGAVSPRLFRVTSVKEVETGIVEVAASFYDSGKYARVEDGVYMPTVPYFTPPSNIPVGQVQNITWTPETFTDAIGKVTRWLRISWSPRSGDFVTHYSYKWQRGLDDWVSGDTQTNVLKISAEYSGLYTIYVYAYSAYGAQSPVATSTYTLDLTGTGPSSTLQPVTGLVVKETGTSTFNQQDCSIIWTDPNTNNPVAGVTVMDYEVTVRDNVTQTLVIRTHFTREKMFNYLYAWNTSDWGSPRRIFTIRVRIRDTLNRYSAATGVTFNNPGPPAPIIALTPGVNSIWVNVKENPEVPDAQGFIVCASESSGFTPSAANQIFKGNSSFHLLKRTNTNVVYFVGAVYDTFSEAFNELTWSAQGSAAAVTDVVPNEWQIDGLTFRGNNPSTNQISWSACTVYKTGGSTGVGTTVSIPSGNATWSSGTLYVYYKEGQTTLLSTNVINTAITDTSQVLATYKGGNDVFTGNGKFFIDGGNIYANTVGATQLVSGSAVITGTAQLANAVVSTAAISDAAVTTIKIADASIVSAKIVDAAITTAKIANASIDTLKLKNGSVMQYVNNSNLIALTAFTKNTSISRQTPSWQCVSPIGMPGGFITKVDFSMWHKEAATKAGSSHTSTCKVEFQESTNGGSSWTTLSPIGAYCLTKDYYIDWPSSTYVVPKYSGFVMHANTGGGPYAYTSQLWVLDTISTTSFMINYTTVEQFFGTYICWPGRLYRANFTWYAYSIARNTYAVDCNYYYGDCALTATVVLI